MKKWTLLYRDYNLSWATRLHNQRKNTNSTVLFSEAFTVRIMLCNYPKRAGVWAGIFHSHCCSSMLMTVTSLPAQLVRRRRETLTTSSVNLETEEKHFRGAFSSVTSFSSSAIWLLVFHVYAANYRSQLGANTTKGKSGFFASQICRSNWSGHRKQSMRNN